MGTRTEFTVERERARRDALLRRARRAQPAAPALILCPEPAAARSIEHELARSGGAIVTIMDWDLALDELERASGLHRVPAPHEASRVAWIEAALEARGAVDRALAQALSVDPHGVARALVPAVDAVRAAGWSGDPEVVREACERSPVALRAPLQAHLELIALGARAVEEGLRASHTLDRLARLQRWLQHPTLRIPAGWRELLVDGVDAVSSVERATLEAIAAAGVAIDVAPWVHGWRAHAPRTVDDPEPARSPLVALARFPMGDRAERDDGSIVECVARDPEEEADAVAEWLASLPERERSSVAVVVPGEAGDGPRVLAAFARHGIRGAYRGTLRVTDVPLWSVLRAVVQLAWRGPDALDLGTVLSAPGSGTWGADRDRICARLRSRRAARWDDVRAIVHECTDPALHGLKHSPDGVAETSIDPAREKVLEEQRRDVLSLVQELQGDPPLREAHGHERLRRLRSVVLGALNRFANPRRIQASVDDARAAGWWVGAAASLRAAASAVLDAIEADPRGDAGADPATFLLRIERMLPALADAVDDRRSDRVRVLSEGALPDARPRTLVVLGFAQGRYPRGVSATPWLGPTERAALARVSRVPALGELPDEGLRAQIALRNAHRLLASPSGSLVLVQPHRGADGGALEPCATRADVLESLPEDVAIARERGEPPHVREALAPVTIGPAAAVRAVARALQFGLNDDSLSALAAHLSARPSDHALFSARLAPSRDFHIAPVLKPLLSSLELSPSDLELATKCRFSFATRSVLGLRWLPLTGGEPWGPRALLAAAHRAARAYEQDPEDIDRAVRIALAHEADAGTALETAAARRTLRGFVRRFGAQRARWGGREITPTGADGSTTDASPSPTRIALTCEHPDAPMSIAVRGDVPRIELVDDEGEPRHVLVDLRFGRTSDAEHDALGVSAGAVILPEIAAGRSGVSVDAIETVSLVRDEGALLAREGTFTARTAAPSPDAPPPPSLTERAAQAKRRFSVVFDAIAQGTEPLPPHDHARREALAKASIRTCERCPSQLLCRFDLPGERP